MSECDKDAGRATATRCTQWRTALSSSPNAGTVPHPAAEAVRTALVDVPCSESALVDALTVYAWEASARDRGLDRTLEDISSLWTLLGGVHNDECRHIPLDVEYARATVVDAWVDAAAADRDAPGLVPISGLHTVNYLVARVHELDRQTRWGSRALVLIVVRWPEPGDPWERISMLYSVDAAIREHVRVDATLVQEGSSMAMALVSDDARARLERRAVESALCDLPRVDLIPVPDERAELRALVTSLREEDRSKVEKSLPGQHVSDLD